MKGGFLGRSDRTLSLFMSWFPYNRPFASIFLFIPSASDDCIKTRLNSLELIMVGIASILETIRFEDEDDYDYEI